MRRLANLGLASLVAILTSNAQAERLHETALAHFSGDVAPFGWTFKGHIEFTPTEVTQHQTELQTLLDTTVQTMAEAKRIHEGWLKSCGVGLMYGYLAPYSTLDTAKRADFLKQHATCATPPAVSDVKVTSCEIFANRFLAKGFAAIGQAPAYKRIDTFLNDNDRDGLALVYALRKLGWKSLYWNTDVNSIPPLPNDRTIVGITPADFREDTATALKNHSYYGVPIDGYLINFEPNAGSPTHKDDKALAHLDKVPYFVGISHAGFHVWSGSYGMITESHSYFDPDSKKNIELGAFHPPQASPTGREVVVGGKKQTFYYYSGIIAVPPGPWMWF